MTRVLFVTVMVSASAYAQCLSSRVNHQRPLPQQDPFVGLVVLNTHAPRVSEWEETVTHTEPSAFPTFVNCKCCLFIHLFWIMHHHLQLFLPCWLEEKVYPLTQAVGTQPHRSPSGCLARSSRLITVAISDEILITRPPQS